MLDEVRGTQTHRAPSPSPHNTSACAAYIFLELIKPSNISLFYCPTLLSHSRWFRLEYRVTHRKWHDFMIPPFFSRSFNSYKQPCMPHPTGYRIKLRSRLRVYAIIDACGSTFPRDNFDAIKEVSRTCAFHYADSSWILHSSLTCIMQSRFTLLLDLLFLVRTAKLLR